MNTTYQPNTDDPRVTKRIKRALGFARGCFSETEEKSFSSRYIDKFFGCNTHALSKWLRQYLLVETDSYYSSIEGVSKKYRLNKSGYDYLKAVINGQTGSMTMTEWNTIKPINHKMMMADLVDQSSYDNSLSYPCVSQVSTDVDLVMNTCEEEYAEQLRTGLFTYEDKSNRYWHPLQSVKREYKRHIFAKYNYRHQYDIVACAPTLIHQYAQQLGMDLYLFTLRDYLKDRTTHRERIARELGISKDTAKRIINALFAGARLSCNGKTDIYVELDCDAAKIKWLQQDEWLKKLRADIKVCWDYLVEARPELRVKRTDKNGKSSWAPLTPTNKWGIYFWLERQVIGAVREWLELTRNPHFLEHDGWNSQYEISIKETIDWIKYRTGFNVCISPAHMTTLSHTLVYHKSAHSG